MVSHQSKPLLGGLETYRPSHSRLVIIISHGELSNRKLRTRSFAHTCACLDAVWGKAIGAGGSVEVPATHRHVGLHNAVFACSLVVSQASERVSVIGAGRALVKLSDLIECRAVVPFRSFL